MGWQIIAVDSFASITFSSHISQMITKSSKVASIRCAFLMSLLMRKALDMVSAGWNTTPSFVVPSLISSN